MPATLPLSALENWNTIGSVAEHAATIIALIVGGFWAYFKFIKGRVYRPRFDISMDAGTVTIDGKKTLLCSLSVKNIGASKIVLLQEGTGLRVTEGVPRNELFLEPQWGESRVFPIFEKHEWIESGETIQEQLFAALPQDGERALKLEARLICKRFTHNVSVFSRAVVPSSAQWKGTEGDKEVANGQETESREPGRDR